MFCAQYESSPVQSRSNVLVSVFEEDVGAVPVEFYSLGGSVKAILLFSIL